MPSTKMPLGRHSPPVSGHRPETLYPIPRADARRRLGIADQALPFRGEDCWTGYELSWLDLSGKPMVRALHVRVPCTSPNVVESKSFKLYLNGLAQVRFRFPHDVAQVLATDLSAATGAEVSVHVGELAELMIQPEEPPRRSLDELAPIQLEYQRNPALLRVAKPNEMASEVWRTDLFRSICPVTGQPDWASILVSYAGRTIVPESLLAYLVSYREHACFHEDAIERIYMDIQERCQPALLTVAGHFLRRGGLDINPYRTNERLAIPMRRLLRQ